MHAKHLLLFGLVMCITSLSVFAEKVSKETARQVALNVYIEKASQTGPTISLSALRDMDVTEKDGLPLYYTFYLPDQRGIIIIAADNRIPPLLAWSVSLHPQQVKTPPPAYSWFMDQLKQQILVVIQQDIAASPDTRGAWSRYTSPRLCPADGIRGVSPLIQTTWDQGCYYNEDCPFDVSAINYCQHALTGCGATAMAQVIKFWGVPVHGLGSHAYNSANYGVLSANFAAATYNYSTMPASLNYYNADVAQLISHCGIAQDMDYGPTTSGSYTSAIDAAFRDYFDYNAAVQWLWKENYSSNQWVTLLANELDAGRPMVYYGNNNGQDGHFFVCDGYQGTDYFHFNWGWSGVYDGYFYTSSLTPGTANYTSSQGAIVNIYPNQVPPPPSGFTMDFETTSDFSMTFNPWTTVDQDGSATYTIMNHTFPAQGEAMAYICFNPAQVSPPMTESSIQPHAGNRFGACFSASTPPNDDWFISPRLQMSAGGEFSFWVKSYTGDYGLERYKVGVSTTDGSPGSFSFISGSGYLEAPLNWTKQTFDLSAYNNQQIYVGIQCVSNDAFIFMIDDLELKPGGAPMPPSYMSLDFESLSNFTTVFDPWMTTDVNGGNTYNIENVMFPGSGDTMAYICFNPSLTTPPLTNMAAHSGQRFGASFASTPPNNPNNKWLISPQIQLGANSAISLWVQSYSDQYGNEKFNIGVSNTGTDPTDFMIVNTGGPVEAPTAWTKKTFSLNSFANQQVYVGIQCVSNDVFIFMIDDIEISGNVGVDDEERVGNVILFPNPASDRFFVNADPPLPENARVQLINALGVTVFSITLSGAETLIEIPTKGLNPGVYYLVVLRECQSIVRKVTIIH